MKKNRRNIFNRLIKLKDLSPGSSVTVHCTVQAHTYIYIYIYIYIDTRIYWHFMYVCVLRVKYFCHCFPFSSFHSIHSLCLFLHESTFITFTLFSFVFRILVQSPPRFCFSFSFSLTQQHHFTSENHKFFIWCLIFSISKLLLFIVLTWMH